MKLRRCLLRLHLWLGMIVGAVVTIVSVTGGVIVFEHEMDAALNRHLYHAAPGDVGHRAVLGAVAAVRPGSRAEMIWWPAPYRPVYAVAVAGPGDERTTVYVDPGTAAVTGTDADRHPLSAILEAAGAVHVNLMAGEVGRRVVSWSVVLFVALLASGVALWWPGLRRPSAGFRVRRHKTWFLLGFDLHRVGGAIAFPFLVTMALTGIVMAFPHQAERVVHGMLLRRPADTDYRSGVPKSAVPPKPAGQAPTIERFLTAAAAEIPDAEPFYITLPGRPDDAVQVRMQKGVYPYPFGTTFRIYLDRYTGAVLKVVDPRRSPPPGRFLEHWNFPLHVGSVGGTPLRIAYMTAAFATPGLAATGTFVWWRKRSKRRRHERDGGLTFRFLAGRARHSLSASTPRHARRDRTRTPGSTGR